MSPATSRWPRRGCRAVRKVERRLFRPDRVIGRCLLTAGRFDEVLSDNIVTVELFDASANDVVIECTARGTPLVVNRHPAAVEYPGESYRVRHSILAFSTVRSGQTSGH